MRSSAVFATLFGLLALAALPTAAQPAASPPSAGQSNGGAADLCRELLSFAEQQVAKPKKEEQAQASRSSDAAAPRQDGQGTGTQGGGSVDKSSSNDTSEQAAAPAQTPVSPGAAPEPATSGHATNGKTQGSGASDAGASTPADQFKLAGEVTLQQVREVSNGDRQACRDMAQKLRRAGAEMPAALIALAAYEPDPAKRQ
jgi:hypothetical protein